MSLFGSWQSPHFQAGIGEAFTYELCISILNYLQPWPRDKIELSLHYYLVIFGNILCLFLLLSSHVSNGCFVVVDGGGGKCVWLLWFNCNMVVGRIK